VYEDWGVKNITAGEASWKSTQAYGLWEYDAYMETGTGTLHMTQIISDTPSSLQNGYGVQLRSNTNGTYPGMLRLLRYTG